MEITENKDTEESVPLLSIIIVTWNGKRYVLECIESLQKQLTGLCAEEVIVVDNGSRDGTPEAIREQFPNVTLIENQANLGFAKANNLGMARSRGKYVCLINSDVVVPAGCLERMLAFMEAHPEIGILGPKMLSPDGSIGASVARLPTVWNTLCCALGLNSIFPHSRLLGGFAMDGYAYDTVDSVEVLTGWFWMISRVALKTVSERMSSFSCTVKTSIGAIGSGQRDGNWSFILTRRPSTMEPQVPKRHPHVFTSK